MSAGTTRRPSRGIGRGSLPAAWLGPALALALAGPPLPAATITVDKFDSSHAADGACSLREAIDSANDDASPYAGADECEPGSGADTIVLNGDVTLDYSPDGLTGLPPVTSRITLEGNNRQIRRAAGSPPFRILSVSATGDLVIEETTLANGDSGAGGAIGNGGRLTLDDSRLLENHASSSGGAIYNLGTLVLRGSEVRDNDAGDEGGGITHLGAAARAELIDSVVTGNAAAQAGGGIRSSAALTLVRSAVSDNVATSGGGLHLGGYSLTTLVESTVDNNAATGWGGGVECAGNMLSVVGTTFSSNTAEQGGGLYLSVSDVSLTGSTLTGNQATVSHGGGIYSKTSSVLSIVNSTLSGNSAVGSGGGIYTEASTVTLDHGTLLGNSASGGTAGIYNDQSDVTVTASILHASPAGVNCGGPTPVVDGGDNFDDDTSCWGIATTTSIDATLADHGGPTETHALYDGSDARDEVPLCPPRTDQRSALRDASCDSGAFEYGVNDRYEWPPGDDECPGRPLQLGVAEHHLHYDGGLPDEDWVWFRPTAAGAEYEILTRNLHGGADTTLQLYQGCSSPGGFDDNGGGETGASRLTHTATTKDVERGRVDVVIREKNDDYAVGEGYDVVVRCLSNCPSCAASGGPVFELDGEHLFGSRLVEACDEIRVEQTRIWSGALAILRSGGSFAFGEGFRVDASGQLVAIYDPALAAP